MNKKLKIGVLISGSGTNMQAIVRACEEGRIDGEVVFVGACNPDAKGLIFAKEAGIPTFIVDYRRIFKNITDYDQPDEESIHEIRIKQKIFTFTDPTDGFKKMIEKVKKRIVAEKILLEEIEKFDFDLLVLAGFMRNLTPYFIDRINTEPEKPRIMNIHPALLPAFPGTDGYGDTFRYGCKVGGCTVHFIDYGEDSRPIIGQKTFPIVSGDTIETIKKKGLQKEYELYPECIQLFAEGQLKVVENEKGRKVVLIS